MTHFANSSCSDGPNAAKCGIVNLEKKQDNYTERMKNTIIENDDYREIVKKYDSPETLFYADPIYEENKKTGKSGMYGKSLEPCGPEIIAKTFSGIEGKAIISFNDSKNVRKAFNKYKDKFQLTSIKTQYSLNSKSNKKKDRKELLITNFKHNCKIKKGKLVCPVKKKRT